MTESNEKAALLEQMGIPQWLQRNPANHSQPSALVVADIANEAPQTQVDSSTDSTGILLSGSTASGWLWLLDKPLSADVQELLADIQHSVACIDGGLVASPDSEASSSANTLATTIKSELITRLVIFGGPQFQLKISTELNQIAVASVNTVPLEELQNSVAAKRLLWADLKNLLLK